MATTFIIGDKVFTVQGVVTATNKCAFPARDVTDDTPYTPADVHRHWTFSVADKVIVESLYATFHAGDTYKVIIPPECCTFLASSL